MSDEEDFDDWLDSLLGLPIDEDDEEFDEFDLNEEEDYE